MCVTLDFFLLNSTSRQLSELLLEFLCKVHLLPAMVDNNPCELYQLPAMVDNYPSEVYLLPAMVDNNPCEVYLLPAMVDK